MHSLKDGKLSGRGYQDDYACFINGLVDLYEASWEPGWLRAALELTARMVERFWDPEESSFYYTEAGAGDLIVRSKNPFDNATPSGNSMAALAMMRLGVLTGDESLWEKGVRTVDSFSGLLERSPTSCPQMGCALDFSLQKPLEIAVVGSRAETSLLSAEVHGRFLPNKVVCGWPPRTGGDSCHGGNRAAGAAAGRKVRRQSAGRVRLRGDGLFAADCRLRRSCTAACGSCYGDAGGEARSTAADDPETGYSI